MDSPTAPCHPPLQALAPPGIPYPPARLTWLTPTCPKLPPPLGWSGASSQGFPGHGFLLQSPVSMCESLPVCLPACQSRALEGQGPHPGRVASSVYILLVLGSHGDRAFHRHPLWSSSDIRGVRYLPEATEPVKSKPNWDSNLGLPKAPSPLLSSPVLKVLPEKAGGTSVTMVFRAPGGASPAS